MSELLYINASPRGQESAAGQAARVLTEALPSAVNVTTVNLFEVKLPDVTPEMISAKFNFAMGASLSTKETHIWEKVTGMANQFIKADNVLFAIPMWNFSIPYKMKHYIDLITHPGLTFIQSESGVKGLASGTGTVIYSRGGDYSPKKGKPDAFDFQSPYLSAWLNLVGIAPINEVLVQRTLAGPDAQEKAVESVTEELESIASKLS